MLRLVFQHQAQVAEYDAAVLPIHRPQWGNGAPYLYTYQTKEARLTGGAEAEVDFPGGLASSCTLRICIPTGENKLVCLIDTYELHDAWLVWLIGRPVVVHGHHMYYKASDPYYDYPPPSRNDRRAPSR